MKLSDFVAQFIRDIGVHHIFAITGGASIHLIDSIARTEGITFVCPNHEQASAMAADAYSRASGSIGVAIATSGPGGTNMITGICCAYYDSVPVLYITGQVSTFRFKSDTGSRQIGFQETEIVEICKPITKYAVLVDNKYRIKYELQKAYYLAKSGRPGPVLVDIPDNLQREDINPDELDSFIPENYSSNLDDRAIEKKINHCIELINESERPALIIGWGVRLAKAEVSLSPLIETLNIPVLPTWGMMDLLPYDHSLNVGSFGTHGTRYGNFTVQNADLIISIGSRLDTHVVGSPFSSFARGAKKVMVDIDYHEIGKFTKFNMNIDLEINLDASVFCRELLKRIDPIKAKDRSAWIKRIHQWKKIWPICPEGYYQEKKINPYVFVKALSNTCEEGEIMISDTGCALAWLMQAFEFRRHQRFFHDFNNTAMGYALPASIGAAFSLNKQIICVVGDGSLQMNIQELSTVIRHELPIKVFVIDNRGYSMIQQTQDQWLHSEYYASTIEGGLGMPDFSKVAAAYGFFVVDIRKNEEAVEKIETVFKHKGPALCTVHIDPSHRVIPQVKFGRPIEDTEPLLDRKEFLENMIIEPLPISKESI